MTGRVSIWRSIYRLIVGIIAVHEKMKKKLPKDIIWNYKYKIFIKKWKNYTQCGKIFSKLFNLKLQNKMFMK